MSTTTVSLATFHSIERAKKRMGINEKKANRVITNAIEKGKRVEDLASWEKNYMQNEAKGDDVTAIAFNGYCYIVNDDGFCVTMYKLPKWFDKKKHYNGKERIRNFKSYSKYCDDVEYEDELAYAW